MYFFFTDTATTEIYTLSLHDALPIWRNSGRQYAAGDRELVCGYGNPARYTAVRIAGSQPRSEEHTSELQSQFHLVCRLLLEKKKATHIPIHLSVVILFPQ